MMSTLTSNCSLGYSYPCFSRALIVVYLVPAWRDCSQYHRQCGKTV